MAGVNRVTIDEKFNDEYARKGMQPFVSKDGRIRNVRMEKKDKRAVGTTTQAVGRRLQRVGRGTYAERMTNRAGKYLYNKGRVASRNNQPARTKATATQKKKTKSTLLARARATTTNAGILSWAVPLWLIFQIPMAIFHIILFGLAALEGAILGMTEEREEDGTLVKVFKFFGRAIKAAFETINGFIADAFGVDVLAFFAKFAPSNIFMLFQMILTMYGFAVLLAIGFIYLFARLKPLSGEGTTLKFSAVIISLVGYMFPFLSLFPWFLVWTTAVWLKPK